MSKSHINSDITINNAHAYKSLPLKNLTIDSDENTIFLAHYDISLNDVTGVRPDGSYVDDNTVLYYDMSSVLVKGADKYLVDRSKYCSHGRVIGTTLVDGRNNKDMQFNGTSDIVQTILNPSRIDSAVFTIEAWVYPSTIASAWMIFGKQEPNARIYCGHNTGGVWDFGVSTSGWGNAVTGALPTVDVNTWQHIVLVLNNGTAKLYKNGVFACSKTYTTFASTLPLYVGGHNSSGTPAYWFNGKMHKFVAVNRVLTDAEIAQRYHEPIATLVAPGQGKFNGAIAIEEATTNLVDPNPSVWTASGTSTLEKLGDFTAKVSNFGRGTTADWARHETNQFTAVEGDSLTLSFYVEEHVGRIYVGFRQYVTGDNTGVGSVMLAENTIQKGWYTSTIQVPAGVLYYKVWVCVYNQSYNFPFEQYIVIKNLQVEKKSFATQFVNGTRVDGRLDYDNILPTGDFTISLWSYRNLNTSADNRYIFDTPDHSFYLINYGNYISLRGTGLTTSDIYRGDLCKNWIHVCITKDASYVKFYINGELVSQVSSTGFTYNRTLMIGNRYTLGTSIFNGYIDELRIDGVARTQDEILAWYVCNTPFAPKGDERLVY